MLLFKLRLNPFHLISFVPGRGGRDFTCIESHAGPIQTVLLTVLDHFVRHLFQREFILGNSDQRFLLFINMVVLDHAPLPAAQVISVIGISYARFHHNRLINFIVGPLRRIIISSSLFSFRGRAFCMTGFTPSGIGHKKVHIITIGKGISMPRSQHSLSQLPVLEDTWLIGTSRLRAWVNEGDSPPTRPYLILSASSNTGMVCGSNLVPEAPTAAQVADVLFKAMQHPPSQLGKACRPRGIALADPALLEPLQILLKDAGLDTEVFGAGFPDDFYEIVRQLEAHLRSSEPEVPAMLDVAKVTVSLLQRVFEAAAEFYRAAPWAHLSNEQVPFV